MVSTPAFQVGSPGSIPGAPTKRGPVAQQDSAVDYGSTGWGFESLQARQDEPVAQLVEHRPFKPGVAGSRPAGLTIKRW